MSTIQINGMYPIEYFSAENNSYARNDNKRWWSSLDRYAENGIEYVEINLGRKRTINYMSFDVSKKPFDITIEYDSVDLLNIDQYSDSLTPRWQSVKRVEGELFDNSISYESGSINPWKHCEFFFTDASGNVLITQRIRIGFKRRVESWPVKDYPQFRWSIDAMNLRMGRYITDIKHVSGFLIDVPNFSGTRRFSENNEIRQRFIVPAQSLLTATPTTDLSNIGSFTPTDITPNLMGFEFMVKPETFAADLSFDWRFYDISQNSDLLLAQGTVKKTTRARPEVDFGLGVPNENVLPEWIRIVFDKPIQSLTTRQYELRIVNNTPAMVDEFYVNAPNTLFDPTTGTEFTDLFALRGETLNWLQNESIVYRVIADVGSAGKDLLGNEYREGVRYNSADNAVDGKIYTNWTCFPNPSPESVEALYFDVRNQNVGASVIDAIEVNCLTPGVMVNVYYSNQQMTTAPTSTSDWENIMWTPIRDGYRLTQKQVIDFPYPVVANWICLEFYNLQPAIVSLPNHPILPEVEFKEFPDWVYTNNPAPAYTAEDPYIERERFVDFKIQDIMAAQIENPSGLRTYFDMHETLDQNYEKNGFGTADPTILSRVSFSNNMYSMPMPMNVDVTTSLGAHVYRRYTSDNTQTHIAEAQSFPRLINNRYVSSDTDRYAGTRDDANTLSFNRVCAHQYAVRKARFNKKAYSVSISEVSFLKKDYAARWDDPIIHDILVIDGNQDSSLIEYNEWMPEQAITIPVGSPIFVTYTVGDKTYTDEYVVFESFADGAPSYAPVPLAHGGEIATSVIAHSSVNNQGSTYFRDQDFSVVYDPASKRNFVQRNTFPARLVVPHVVNTEDKYTVTGIAIIDTWAYENAELGNYIEGQGWLPLSTGDSTLIDALPVEIHGVVDGVLQSLHGSTGGNTSAQSWILTDL